MTTENLTRDQQKFLEECNFEFCDRYTDADVEYKLVYDAGIPPPPIMSPWFAGRNRFNNRDRPNGSRYNDRNNFRSSYDRRGGFHDRRGYDSDRRNYHPDRRETQHYSRFQPY